MLRMKNVLCAMLLCALTACVHVPAVADFSGNVVTSPSLAGNGPVLATLPFRLDDNRIFVEVTFIRPDGAPRKVLAFVNMGAGALVLSNALFRELAPAPGKPLRMNFGAMTLAIDGAVVEPETLANNLTVSFSSDEPSAAEAARGPGGLMDDFAAPLPVEAEIPPGLLQHFVVAYDYAAKTMTLAIPGALKPEGVAVPLRINPKSGFAVLDVVAGGTRRAFVLDNGGSYGLIRDAAIWTDAHPDWLRATGGVGESNYLMNGGDTGMAVVKLRDARLGPLHLDEIGAAQIDPGGLLGGLAAGLFWSRIYDPKAGEPVDGAIGGNVLKSFRLTIDYPDRTSYWLQQAPLDAHDLDQVGITLAHMKGVTTIAGLAQKNGTETVTGIAPGDTLRKIDGAATAPMTRGGLLSALHGKPGERKRLTLERDGKEFIVEAPVTAF